MRSWQESAALACYSALTWALQPLLRRKLRRRGRQEPGYLQDVGERFGHYATSPEPGGWLWIHAVSLGETRAAAVLLARLREQHPGLRLLLTHSTATGRAEGQRLLQAGDRQLWLPWDTPAAVRRFLDHFRPALGVLMETEVWPNLVRGCQQRGVPLLLLNARLNERSARKALRWPWLMRPAYRELTAVYAQTAADAERLQALDAPVQGVYGNLKFDVPWHPEPWSRGHGGRQFLRGRPVLMLASSREGEEVLWWSAWAAQRRSLPEGGPPPLWLIVPRHPQRFDEVEALLSAQGCRVFRRSRWPEFSASAGWPDEALSADVWLGDSLGEMALYYGLADLALLGGSFLPLGGQNLIEAAACECPVIMGPHTFNFSEAAEWAEAAGAAVRVPDMAAAVSQAMAWLRQPGDLQAARAACQVVIERGAGAVERYAQAVQACFRVATGR
ncbi:MAG TPA: 3-deoxy-D-manno-octulosonic acid transferase [Macromonas sp.]|nr:3-deoxy-D-manno-octulosonic acid transferase [Macromonas sp.]